MDLIHKILKYSLKILIVLVLLRFLPYSKREFNELLIVVLLIALSTILIDNGYDYLISKIFVEEFNVEKLGNCSIVCNNVSNANKSQNNSIDELNNNNINNDSLNSDMLNENDINNNNDDFVNNINNNVQNNNNEQIEQQMDEQMDEQYDVQIVDPEPTPQPNKINITNLEGKEESRVYPPYETDMGYSDPNSIPVPKSYKSRDYELGYSYIPPEKWYPEPIRPPVCKTEKTCPVCPVYTQGTPIDMKEWDSSRKVLQPDNINIKYIAEKLNKIEEKLNSSV